MLDAILKRSFQEPISRLAIPMHLFRTFSSLASIAVMSIGKLDIMRSPGCHYGSPAPGNTLTVGSDFRWTTTSLTFTSYMIEPLNPDLCGLVAASLLR